MVSNLKSVVMGVKNDSWNEKGLGMEPWGTPTSRRQQRQKGQEKSRGGWEKPDDYSRRRSMRRSLETQQSRLPQDNVGGKLKVSRAEWCLKRVHQSFPRQVKRGQVMKCLLMRLF